MTKKDFLFTGIAALLIGVLGFFIVESLQIKNLPVSTVFISFVLFFGTLLAAGIGNLLGKKIPVILELVRFVIVGGLNTFVDFAVLNGLMYVTGISSGWQFSVFKGSSFIVAVINSYVWNKWWTFGGASKSDSTQIVSFLTVSAIGFGINVAAASLLVNLVGNPLSAFINDQVWANCATLAAVALSMVWNFLGYKFFVFTKKTV